jgi:hypothetical protein
MAVPEVMRDRGALLIGGGVALVAAVLVLLTLQRPTPPMYAPSPVQPDSAGEARVGPVVRTVDATASDAWTFFSFQAGSVVRDPGPTDWDLAFRRFQIIANGGSGFFGEGGILDLGEVPFDSVRTVPAEGYVPTVARGDSVNAAIREWYDYSFLSHLLTPRPTVYAVRTADGRKAKMEILGYYCPGAQPGCPTFRYVYQGGGGTDLYGTDLQGEEQASADPAPHREGINSLPGSPPTPAPLPAGPGGDSRPRASPPPPRSSPASPAPGSR